MIRNLLFQREDWEKVAVIDKENNIRYRELAQKALAIRERLPRTGAANIGILLPNGGDYIAALFGIFGAGLTAFPFPVQITKYEVLSLLKQASVSVVVSTKRFSALWDALKDREHPRLQVIYVEELDGGEGEMPASGAEISPDGAMVLLSTSGTTGKARIVQLSERNVEASVFGYLDKINFEQSGTKDIRLILATPFTSAYGLMILCACLLKSIPLVLLEDGFTLDLFYKTVQEHRVTHYEGGAVVLLWMEQTVGRPIPYDISSLNYFGFGGSKVSGKTVEKLMEAYPGKYFWQGYGMTETSPLITKHVVGVLKKPASVGTAIKGMTIAVERDGALTQIPYTTGEIVVKGDNVMLGYYRDEAETEQIKKDGYLYTGDIGYLDEDGYLYICGRKKNVIISRGFNIYPEEVEACILNSLLAQDCVVYGERDAYGNEIVCADIVPKHENVQIEEIKAYCRTHLAAYKQPRKVRFTGAIKKAAAGKTRRGDGNQ